MIQLLIFLLGQGPEIILDYEVMNGTQLNAIAAQNGVIHIAADDGLILSKTGEGIWIDTRFSATRYDFDAVIFFNGEAYVSGRKDAGGVVATVLCPIDIDFPSRITGMATDGTTLFAYAEDQTFWTSTDGLTFNQQVGSTTLPPVRFGVTHLIDGVYLTGGSHWGTSSNGLDWNTFANAVQAFAFNGSTKAFLTDTFMGVTTGPVDGTWTFLNHGMTDIHRPVMVHTTGSVYYAFGENTVNVEEGIIYETDDISQQLNYTEHPQSLSFPAMRSYVKVGFTVYLAGDNGTILSMNVNPLLGILEQWPTPLSILDFLDVMDP